MYNRTLVWLLIGAVLVSLTVGVWGSSIPIPSGSGPANISKAPTPDPTPIIAYFNHSLGKVKMVKCGNAACSTGNTLTDVDRQETFGHTSIAYGSDGLPAIAYFGFLYPNGYHTRMVHCAHSACEQDNTRTTLEPERSPSIAIGSDGFPVIAYMYRAPPATQFSLKVLKCGNLSCTAGNTVSTVWSNASEDVSIATGADGLPVIAFFVNFGSNGTLFIAHCGNLACSAGNTITPLVIGTVPIPVQLSLKIGADGLPILAATTGSTRDLVVYHCNTFACNSFTSQSQGNNFTDISMTIGDDGLPLIAFYNKVLGYVGTLHCTQMDCMGTGFNTFSTIETTSAPTSLAVRRVAAGTGRDGFPIIAYYDDVAQDLKAAKCRNYDCSGMKHITTLDSTGDVGFHVSIAT